ncbi:hypothetical protein AAVH_21524 [Aphelenchoides avenae]|nr:hypothetical protein AAVH_21524 [Aphelenchus avenae]
MDRLNAWTDKDWNLKQKVPSHIAISCRISLSDSTLFFGPRADSALKLWKEIMGKGCDTEDAVEEYYRKFRDNYTTVAKSENFEGGDTNKCLHKFFIRYTNYDEEIYEAFAGIMAEILFIELNFHGFCLPIIEPDNYEAWSRRAREDVVELAKQVLAAKDDVLKGSWMA